MNTIGNRPGRKKVYHTKRIKIQNFFPLSIKVMLEEIAQSQNKTATDALIDLIAEEHDGIRKDLIGGDLV
ncbi:hypothetical protein A8L34_28205 [Bacillus sp. FJAT-27264]|uniref:hypothetical protein n=1 Tax=Paenibacillus sp. (strain DSM 101736 / FJAT-27264) TaxID=1850362 RepID=UPI000807E60C|nr:hypothetical protein [Bacillus sp. FJAT-27264]OBZ15932.1 hypothetical protein A8L34_28205 [Bacillus sp. FJAT-27264]